MFASLKADIQSLRCGFRKQDAIFYFGVAFIVFYYLRPQYLFSPLLVVPWLQLTILVGLFLIVGKNRLQFTKGHFLVLLFALIAWLSAQTSLYPSISSKDISTPFIFFAEVLFLSNCIKSTQQLKILLIVFFACIFKMSFFGARVWASRGFGFADWGIQGPPGFFQNSGEFSLLMAISAVLSIPFIASFPKRSKLYWLLPVTAVMTVIASSSRGSQLALFAGLLYLLVSMKKIKVRSIFIGLLAAFLVWSIIPEAQKERFYSAGDDQTSKARLAYWRAGIDMTLKNPILGIGYDAFPEHYHRYYKLETSDSYVMQRREVAHNSLVSVASTLGIPALLIYLSFHGIVYRRKRSFGDPLRNEDFRLLNKISLGLNAAVITYFIGAFFMSVQFYPFIYFLMTLSIISARLYRNGYKETQAVKKKWAFQRKTLA